MLCTPPHVSHGAGRPVRFRAASCRALRASIAATARAAWLWRRFVFIADGALPERRAADDRAALCGQLLASIGERPRPQPAQVHAREGALGTIAAPMGAVAALRLRHPEAYHLAPALLR